MNQLYAECEEVLKGIFRQWSDRPEFNPRSSHTKDSKIVLVATLLNTQHYKVRINGKVEHSREGRSAIPYTLMLELLKREPSGRTRLRSPTFYFIHIYQPLRIYHLFVLSNFKLLHKWITFPIHLCLVLYSFSVNLRYSLMIWVIVSSLWLHNRHS